MKVILFKNIEKTLNSEIFSLFSNEITNGLSFSFHDWLVSYLPARAGAGGFDTD